MSTETEPAPKPLVEALRNKTKHLESELESERERVRELEADLKATERRLDRLESNLGFQAGATE